MINSANETEFAQYEAAFWKLVGAQAIEGRDPKVLWVGPAEVQIDGQHIVRVCRKIKTKNGK
jgi:hypothetical protein